MENCHQCSHSAAIKFVAERHNYELYLYPVNFVIYLLINITFLFKQVSVQR